MKNEEEKEEGMKQKLEKIDKLDIIFAIIFLAAVFIRVWQFGKIPGGINQDEAFSGYEAYSLLNYGKDSSGYANPVYFEAWGSGMNALNSYLMMPFIAIFGLKVWAIRIPQCIIACLTILAVYLLVNEMFNKKISSYLQWTVSYCTVAYNVVKVGSGIKYGTRISNIWSILFCKRIKKCKMDVCFSSNVWVVIILLCYNMAFCTNNAFNAGRILY